MQNLEQVRARNALNFANSGAVSGKQGGDVIKKVAPLIQNHGLLATAAFSFADSKEDNADRSWGAVFDAIATHLADESIAIVPGDARDRKSLMVFLTAPTTTSETLKLATAEAAAWLTYARRFVKKA